MPDYVDISFECLPLRSVARFDVPLDATDELTAKIERIKSAATKHGRHNSYYLHDGSCVFHLTNDPAQG